MRAFRVTIDQEALSEVSEQTAPPEPPGIPTDAPAADGTALDLAMWDSVKDSGDVEQFLHYLQRFPEGEFAALARDRIAARSQTSIQSCPASRSTNAENVMRKRRRPTATTRQLRLLLFVQPLQLGPPRLQLFRRGVAANGAPYPAIETQPDWMLGIQLA